MLIYKIKENNLETFILPQEIKGNYWFTDTDINENKTNLINIEAKDNKWILSCNFDYDLFYNGEKKESVVAEANVFYFLKSQKNGEVIIIVFIDTYDGIKYYSVPNNSEIIVGSNAGCQICYNNNYIAVKHAQILYRSKRWFVTNLDEKYQTFVDNYPISTCEVFSGDVIFIMGLRIIPMGHLLIISNPGGQVQNSLQEVELNFQDFKEEDDDPNLVSINNNYFSRAPRFRSKIETIEITIDDPPNKETEEKNSWLLTYGPMLTMSLTSIVSIGMGISQLGNGGNMIGAVTSFIFGGTMICSALVWPLLRNRYTKKTKAEKEALRVEKYTQYIEQKKQEILGHITQQKQILQENFMTLDNCAEVILNEKSKLWERKNTDEDFLVVRLGLGTVPVDININYSKEQFTMDPDALKDLIQNVVKESKDIPNAPISVSLIEKRIIGIIGNYDLTSEFVKGILLQLMTFYSSDMVKIVLLTNEKNNTKWNAFKVLPHIWSNDKSERYYAITNDELKEVAQYLEKEFTLRENTKSDLKENKYKAFDSYYLIITDNFNQIADYSFMKKILKSSDNLGFSVLIVNDRLSNLPNECNCFINISAEMSGLIENELLSTNQKIFKADYPENINIYNCCLKLANIPIRLETKQKGLPDSYGLLELYNIGKVEHLNSLMRWKQNDPTLSLSAPIGMGENGETFKIDLHEKFHGPHGLIAGTTGSGKSEWIITFILSLAINYSPNEVSFVIIDYKGGGLALAFENKELGIRLPHIAGTITNLDANELNRSLASIDSELKRRQREFNKARDISGESTIDIYKYQRLYRDGVVDQPISHLFIICDEFAELKQQQPDFMDQLVSTSRIGRSLGVHLILATQKPSGVVNDQIWSNSRFKVCLKVQDKNDSNDMIKVPDAAALKQAGRFYLLVGYNDYFAIGQAAYCGMPYIPSEKIIKKIDTSLNFIDNVGNIRKSIDDIKIQENTENHGEVLLNVVKYLADIASSDKIEVKKLWLDKIPALIYVDNLKNKYNYQKQDYVINPVLGEYDNPTNQSQHLLTLPLTTEGNTIIFGMASSGKENLIMSLVYSIITTYTPVEVNMYIIDCGAETLKLYNNVPQIGDVLLVNDQEKIVNLIRMINSIIAKRKKLFVEYGGSLTTYNTYSDKREPTIVVIINNYENFMENYGDAEEVLVKITREGAKYGIIFVITAAASNSIRGKVRQNFTQLLTLQMIDPYDYVSILGNHKKIIPSAIKGRGLVRIDDVYEFQTASICEESALVNYIRNLCQQLKNTYQDKARPIPVLPNIVNLSVLQDEIKGLNEVPIGVAKNSLNIDKFDFENKYFSMISATDLKPTKKFVNGLVNVLKRIPNINLAVVDKEKLMVEDVVSNITYINSEYKEFLEKLMTYMRDINKIYVDANYDVSSLNNYQCMVVMIIGINDLLTQLDEEFKNEFVKLLAEFKLVGKVNFIFVDNSENIKKYAYDDWYRNNFDGKNGIWVGTNLGDQNIFKVNNLYRMNSEKLAGNFGFIIEEGEYELVKLVSNEEESDEQ